MNKIIKHLAVVFTSLVASTASAAVSWNTVTNAPSLNDIAVGNPTSTGPELWGLSSSACDSCDRGIYHRAGGKGSSWVQVVGAATHIAASPTAAFIITSTENQVYKWNGTSWTTLSMAGGPTCVRRIATYGAYMWVRDCQASPKIWRWTASGGWQLYTNQFSGPGIVVDIVASPNPTGVPWIVNYDSVTGNFQLYYSFSTGWALAGGAGVPTCVEHVGMGPGGVSGFPYSESWVTTCSPSGNGFFVMYHPNATAGWQFPGSPGMVQIKVDTLYGIPYATDNNGTLWRYCDPAQPNCG